jgi:hypothetical protein
MAKLINCECGYVARGDTDEGARGDTDEGARGYWTSPPGPVGRR